MMLQRLLKLTIVDALDRVWSEAGITPSKKTRQTIIRAAEKISSEVQDDFVKASKEAVLYKEKWEFALTPPNRRAVHSTETAELDEPISAI
jgi:hypothetical protein